MPKTELLPEGIKNRVQQAALHTWQTIAVDLPIGPRGMPRAEVIDVTLDADYMETHGGDREAVAELRKLSFADQKKVLREVFKAARYE